jgi:hypothetical protein
MSDKPPAPKRGAIPTPKDVREKAPRYVPDDAKNRQPERTQLDGDQRDAGNNDTDRK